MNIFRKLLIAALEHNSGYRDSRYNQYALAWNVKLYRVDASFEGVCAKLKEENPKAARLAPYLRNAGLIMWDEQAEFELAMEDVREGIDGKATGTAYAGIGTATATRFGIPYYGAMRRPITARHKRRTTERAVYPSGVRDWIRVAPFSGLTDFDVSYGFAGRSGGYIVMTEFEGQDLQISCDDFVERLRTSDEHGHYHYTNAWCQKLCAMIYECDQMFTTQNAAAEIMHQMAFRLGWEVEEWQKQRNKFKAERRERRYWESRDVVTA
jgi:hypothetical protein